MKLNLLLFIISQLAHILANAFYAAQNVNTKWGSVGHYLQTSASKLITQLILSVGVYMVLIENPTLLDSMGVDFLSKLLALHGSGTAIVLGWFFDSILEKVLGFWGLKSQVLGGTNEASK